MPSGSTKDWLKKLKAPFSRSKNKKNIPNIAITASASVPDFQQANLQLGSFSIGRHSDVGPSLEQDPSAVAGTVADTQVQDQTQTQTQSSVPIANVLNTPQGQGTSSAVNVKTASSAETSYSGKKETALRLTDNSLTFLKEFAEFIPVPGIGAVLGAVSKCIQTYLKVTENDKQVLKLTQELQSKLQAIEKHTLQAGKSPEVVNNFEILKQKLEVISDKVDGQNKTSMPDHLRSIVNAVKIEEEIKSYFNEIQAACDECSNEILLIIQRKVSTIWKDVLIKRLNYSQNALHDTVLEEQHARNSCTPGTREQILDSINEWAESTAFNSSLGYWMCGMAGTGKSTIARSVCMSLKEKEHLAAAFFCSRQLQDCRKFYYILPTIAYQLSHYSYKFAEVLHKNLEIEENLARKTIAIQLTQLIIEPWKAAKAAGEFKNISPVIVIDALDECEEIDKLLLVLIPAVQNQKLPGLKFFLTSRPEKQITHPMKSLLQVDKFELHNVEEKLVQGDIFTYVKAELEHLKISNEDIRLIVEKAGKLFIYAATIVRYVRGGLGNARLRNIISPFHKPTKTETMELDLLYSDIISSAISQAKLSDEERIQFLDILHTSIICGLRVSCTTIAQLLKCYEDVVESTIHNLQSVLYISPQDQSIYTFHASFGDYIIDLNRSGAFCCEEAKKHNMIASACFGVMERGLKFNICNLPSSFVKDVDVPDIQSTIKAKSDMNENVITELGNFLNEKVVFWIEAMNLMRKKQDRGGMKSRTCMEVLDALISMKNENMEAHHQVLHSLSHLAGTFGLNEVNEYTPHLYLSVLPFWADTIPVAKKFQKTMKVIQKSVTAEIACWRLDSEVNSMAISPNGKKIVTGSFDRIVRIWDADTGASLGELEGHTKAVASVSFSPDGKKIVSGSPDHTLRIWDVDNGTPIGESLKGHSSGVTSVAFSCDGSRIVSGSWDKTVRIWDAATGHQMGELKGHNGAIQSVVFSPDGSKIASGSGDKTIRIWNVDNGAPVGEPLQGHGDWVYSVTFSPDGKTLASGSEDGTIRIWDMNSGTLIGEPLQMNDGVTFVAFSLNGKNFISCCWDNAIRIWDADTRAPIGGPLQGHTSLVYSVAFFPDGKKIASASWDKTVRIWNAEIETSVAEAQHVNDGRILSVAMSPDGKRIVSGCSDNTVKIWDAETGSLVGVPLEGHEGVVLSVGISPDGKRIVSGSNDNTVMIWDTETWAPIVEPLQGHDGAVNSVGISPYGSKIVSGSFDKTIRIWNAETGIPIGEPLQGHDNYVMPVAFSPDGKKIVSGSADKSIRIWSTDTMQSLGEPLLGHSNQVYSVAFSPDGRRIVSGSSDETVRIWDVDTGTLVGEPLQHDSTVWSVAFSPDGKKIVSGSDDKTVRVWDAETGMQIGEPLHGHESSVISVTFSPDGSKIISGSDDKTIRIWNTHPKSPKSWEWSPDGWIHFSNDPEKHGIAWIPPQFCKKLWVPGTELIIPSGGYNEISLEDCVYGENWAECYQGE